jgi:hypothetical protein
MSLLSSSFLSQTVIKRYPKHARRERGKNCSQNLLLEMYDKLKKSSIEFSKGKIAQIHMVKLYILNSIILLHLCWNLIRVCLEVW